jgi:hypothetical protein
MSVSVSNKFCSACGQALIETAVVCPKCGSPTSRYLAPSYNYGKSKSAAVVLAVFLGTWSWLYTYKANSHKFWLTFSITLLLVVWSVISIAQYVSMSRYSYISDSQQFALNLSVWTLLGANLGFWLWSILDNAIKPDSFYENYGSR